MNDNPVLIAPRPVRVISGLVTRPHPVRFVSAPVDQFERVKITDETDIDDIKVGVFTDSTSDRDLSSPRTSSRSSLPSEALEEFLSILRPSFFPPTSPILRARRQGATSLATFPYERPHCKSRRLELVQQKHESGNLYGIEQVDRSCQPSREASGTPEYFNNQDDGAVEFDIYDPDGVRPRWFTSNAHSSPISRMHTRNPFQRHPSYEMALAGLLPASPSPLSPAAVPLPLPTPDEMIEVS